MHKFTYRIVILICIFYHALSHARTVIEVPLSEVDNQEIVLKIDLSRQYNLLTSDEKGYIPGVLTYISDDPENETQYYANKSHFKTKWPSVVGILIEKTDTKAETIVNKIKAKVKNDFFIPPELIQEQSEITSDYAINAIGFIIGYSGRPDIDVVYLRYYSSKNSLCGIQLVKTLGPRKNGAPVSISEAKEELKILTKFADKAIKLKFPKP